ncbi:hypothetical protein [Streptomyces sp. NPDC055509]
MSGTDPASVLDGARVMPVLTVRRVSTAGPLADALAEGGARCAEVTFRTPDAEQVLQEMAAHGGAHRPGPPRRRLPARSRRPLAAGRR